MDINERRALLASYIAQESAEGAMTFILIGEGTSIDQSEPVQVICTTEAGAVRYASGILYGQRKCMTVAMLYPTPLTVPLQVFTAHAVSGEVRMLRDCTIEE